MQRWSNHVTDTLRTFVRRGGLFLLAALVAVTMTVSPIMSRPAHAQGLSDLLSLGGSFTNGLSGCAIETVGWVICPTMRSIARLADYGFSYINSNFLKIDYSIASNTSGTYKAWELMRTIANALFVVAFMILIYSQLTGRNSGGYNIKRLLPRLIIAAIAVNVSYYICVAVVDVSNILGDSILSLFIDKNIGIAPKVGHLIMPVGQQAGGAFQDGTLTVITTSIMGKTGTAWVLLAPAAAVIVSIATICAAGLIILIMRKTVVAMLILASPVLFVVYLLPNLERYFFSAVRLFVQLMLLYPIVALLLGAGQVVSATIVTVGTNDANYRVSGDSYFSQNGGSGSAITDLTASAAAVVPLLGVWFIFKNMSSIMSTAGSRLSASVAGRRGNEGDKEARIAGKAAEGAKNANKLGNFGRRQAFSRNKHRATMAGSALTAEQLQSTKASRSGQQNAQENALDASVRGKSEDAAGQLEGQQSAVMEGQAEQKGMGATLATAVLGAKGREKKGEEKQVTAKDIFNNMNQAHKSKDSDRKFGAGPAPAGGGVVAAGGAAPTAPVASYRAPEIAQSSNIVSGSAAGQPVQVIAIPVQVDGSSLLAQNHAAMPPTLAPVPTTDTEKKAEERAQKYLFDAEKELEEDRIKQDILGHKTEPLTEQPHVPVAAGADKKEGS